MSIDQHTDVAIGTVLALPIPRPACPPCRAWSPVLSAGDQARHGGLLIVMGKAKIVPIATSVWFLVAGWRRDGATM